MAERRVTEEGAGCYEDVWEDYGGEVAFELESVLEHGECESDD